ncbi:MAG: sugar nucleotide-binding protein [Prosthecobacter sp.]|nr:sugar nucleotide-binding protein [Prosthecobacter sp.]
MSKRTSITQLILTGSDGMLGRAIQQVAARHFPEIQVTPIASARRGGFDLCSPQVVDQLLASKPVSNPETAALIHAAASIEWSETEVLARNSLMAAHAASWSRQAGISHSVYVSSVSVYATAEVTPWNASCQPDTLYGVSKLAGELAWQALLPADHLSIARMAGILGWQESPGMFWNKLLNDAVSPTPQALEFHAGSSRNYVTTLEAAECLLHLAVNRVSGTHLVAGRDEVTLGRFVALLEALASKSLPWRKQSEGGERCYYQPSPEILPLLRDFENRLTELWQNRPAPVSSSVL